MGAGLAGLRDQLQAREFFQQLPADLRAFADQHDDVRIAQPHRQLAHTLDGIGEDLGVERLQQPRTVQLAYGVLVVVKNDDVHCL